MSATILHLGSPPSVTLHRLVSVASAAITAFIGWVGIHVVGGIDLVVGSGRDAQTIGAARITASALAAALLGWGVLVAIEHRIGPGRKALQLWCRISIGVLVVSLIGPLTAEAVTSTRWWLVALHTSVGAAFISAMSRIAANDGRR